MLGGALLLVYVAPVIENGVAARLTASEAKP